MNRGCACSSRPTLCVGDFDQAQCLRIWIVGHHRLDFLDQVSLWSNQRHALPNTHIPSTSACSTQYCICCISRGSPHLPSSASFLTTSVLRIPSTGLYIKRLWTLTHVPGSIDRPPRSSRFRFLAYHGWISPLSLVSSRIHIMSVLTTSPHVSLSYFLFPISRFYPPRPVLCTLCYGHCILFPSHFHSHPLVHSNRHDHHQQSRLPRHCKTSPIHHRSQFPSLSISLTLYLHLSLFFYHFCTIILVFISTFGFFFPSFTIGDSSNPGRAVRAMLFCSAGCRLGWHLPLPFSHLQSSTFHLPTHFLSFHCAFTL